MSELVEWLKAQLDEDERVALAATAGPWFVHDTYLDRGGYTATVLSGEIGHGELRAWLPTMRSDVAWDNERNVWNDAKHIARHDPARVLREVEAKRRIIDLYARTQRGYIEQGSSDDFTGEQYLRDVLRLLALPYSDRPGYQEEWRP